MSDYADDLSLDLEIPLPDDDGCHAGMGGAELHVIFPFEIVFYGCLVVD